MAKEVLSVRVHAKLKAWVERRARLLSTSEAYIVGQCIKERAGAELSDFDPEMPHKEWNKHDD